MLIAIFCNIRRSKLSGCCRSLSRILRGCSLPVYFILDQPELCGDNGTFYLSQVCFSWLQIALIFRGYSLSLKRICGTSKKDLAVLTRLGIYRCYSFFESIKNKSDVKGRDQYKIYEIYLFHIKSVLLIKVRGRVFFHQATP